MAFLGLIILIWAPAAHAQSKRIALVIGNSKYQHTSVLANAGSDAKSISDGLQQIGFDVTHLSDLDYVAMRNAVRIFGHQAGEAEMAIVYFAGHGLEAGGDNWLVPISAKLEHEKDLDFDAVSLRSVLDAVRPAKRLRLIVLDACRNNPLSTRMGSINGLTRSATRGLGLIEPGGDVLVAYSARHGTVAEDGPEGGMSPFAQGLLQHYATPGLDVRILFGRVRDHVLRQTQGRQEPFSYGSVGGNEIALVERQPGPSSTAAKSPPGAGPSQDEIAWYRATAANRLEGYRDYLARFPQGVFKADASSRVVHLEKLAARWKGLQASQDRVALEKLVIDAESTEFSDLLKQRLKDLYLAEQRAWEKADTERMVRAYEAFLADWPSGRNAQNARQRLAELAEIGKQWAQLKSSDDEAALAAFISKHGWSEFGAAAVSRLVALRRDKAGSNDHLKVLAAAEIEKALDGARLVMASSGARLMLDTKANPSYRAKLGKDFFKRQFKKSFASEGAFVAEVKVGGRQQRIEGLAGLVKSEVDHSATLFLLQMHGNEQTANDVDRKDRLYSTLQIIQDHFGYVCVQTSWEPTLSSSAPQKVVERCKVTR